MVEFCELCVIFLSTPSARRATFNKVHKTNLKYISIHALCEEGDIDRRKTPKGSHRFLSTPSARRATPERRIQRLQQPISIHALCEEGDAWARPRPACSGDFYPRPLRGGRRRSGRCSRGCCYFYPRPLRGGRLGVVVVGGIVDNISIHALCEEGDRGISCRLVHLFPISIHALCEEGDLPGRAYGLIYNISIHALCEEGDNPTATYESIAYNFYPRPLRGGRRSRSCCRSGSG